MKPTPLGSSIVCRREILQPDDFDRPIAPRVRAGRSAGLAWLLALIFIQCGVAHAATANQGSDALGVVIERATGSVLIVDRARRAMLARVDGLGDLSHASVVFSPDRRYAYVFGRDGGLTKIDLQARQIANRIIQAGNAIGGAIGKNGRVIAVANYDPGGVRLFDAITLAPLAEIAAAPGPDGKRSKVVGIADAPGDRFVFSLFEAGEIWVADVADPRAPRLTKHTGVGKLPYDGLITPDGRHYIAGLFGEDGLALLDLTRPEAKVTRILDNYGRGNERLPVYKMPHLRGWAVAGRYAFLPAVGKHEVLVVDRHTWQEVTRIAVHGQPIFVMGRPDGEQVWVNFALPRNDHVQVIDVKSLALIKTLTPGKAIMHMEFTATGDEIWISARDDDRVVVYDTRTFTKQSELVARHPSGIFLSWRADRIGL
jgi:protein NirF